MSLVSADLRRAILPLFDPATMPTDDPVGAWVRAYSTYAQGATAGVAALTAPLIDPSVPGPFTLDLLDVALRTMWMAAVWAGPGVTAVTAIVPPLQAFLLPLVPTLIAVYDRETAPTLIAEALHTYTLSITATVTPASGTPVATLLA